MTPKEIRDKDKDIHAFLEVFEDPAPEQAWYGAGALSGKTISIKDNLLLEGHKASAGSKILENFTAISDATVIRKIKEAGAIIVGRTNMDEFGMGSSTENSAYGVTKNPHNLERVPGGSSGGAAASVAAGMCDMALGSDTGGSIRQPAAFCGVVGLKPTYGRVSRFGLIAYGSSLDQIGPLTKTVTDAEIIYNVIKGEDFNDSTSINDDTYPNKKKFNKTIGIPRDFVGSEGVSGEVKKSFKEAEDKLKTLGYEIHDIKLPSLKYSLSAYYIIALAEASANLARFDGVKYGLHVDGENSIDDYFKTRGAGFGKEVRRRIILGTYVLSSGYYDAYYGKAIAVRKKITQELREAFKKYDLIVLPTTPNGAWKIGEKSSDPVETYIEDIFTVPVNIAGIPAISIPNNLQLWADLGREDNLFRAGKEFLGEIE
ncbi:MAG: Asp-tRNA(Asn)/Glu-tRNA(Gln) amidotransferase subunit GatA [Candidatus Zambryskibacteria bacterium]|nr:Asp-tRNA(Asn)/Glu-tRNA(Gln) amidotransferase subunit GatA [Candidatus Zambryskibacteria bacterium]